MLLMLTSLNVDAQEVKTSPKYWYYGVGGGVALGQCTFRSISDGNSNIGAQAGIFGGRAFNSFMSIQGGVNIGAQTQTSLDCDPLWLSKDGHRTFAPIIDHQGSYYKNIDAKTSWLRLSLQPNFNVLAPISKKFSLTLSPQISAVATKTRHKTPEYTTHFDAQWHFGYGAQAAIGFRTNRKIGINLYGGFTCLGGDRYDNIPEFCHSSNCIFDAGIQIVFRRLSKLTTTLPPPPPNIPRSKLNSYQNSQL